LDDDISSKGVWLNLVTNREDRDDNYPETQRRPLEPLR
jgi:hypothetical protein